jgi:hypothetical protein
MQSEGSISGLSNLKRKMDKIDKERELFKIEHSKLEDEVSSVVNSLLKLDGDIIAIRQDMMKLSSTLCKELAELKISSLPCMSINLPLHQDAKPTGVHAAAIQHQRPRTTRK